MTTIHEMGNNPQQNIVNGKKVAKLVNLQAGEIKKIDKPFPCTVAWNYKGENESVMNM